MHNGKSLEDLSAEQKVIWYLLYDTKSRARVIEYVLGAHSTEEIQKKLMDAFTRDSGCGLGVVFSSYSNAIVRVLTEEESFFRTIRDAVKIINMIRVSNGNEKANKNDVDRYLKIYNTTMGGKVQYLYVNQVSVYNNIQCGSSSDEEMFIFGILAGWEFKRALNLQKEMLQVGDYAAFTGVAQGGHVGALECLWKLAGELHLQGEMLQVDNYAAFKEAAQGGHVKALECLWKFAEELQLQEEMLQMDYGCVAFKEAAQGGHIGVLECLWEFAKGLSLQKEVLQADDYDAFKGAAQHCHAKALECLWEFAGEVGLQKEVLQATASLFKEASGSRCSVKELECLWRFALTEVGKSGIDVSSYFQDIERFLGKGGQQKIPRVEGRIPQLEYFWRITLTQIAKDRSIEVLKCFEPITQQPPLTKRGASLSELQSGPSEYEQPSKHPKVEKEGSNKEEQCTTMETDSTPRVSIKGVTLTEQLGSQKR